MEQSKNYNFNLPSKNDETSADIDLISDNFRTVDDIVKQVQDDVSKIPTNLVNGSADGSLRGIDTWSSEDDEADYKIGENAVTLGIETRAKGRCSFAEGYHTTANGSEQHVKGRYNIPDNDNKYADIVGNGYYRTIFENKLSNAYTLDWDGNAWFAGDVYVGGTSQDDESATKLSGVATDITQVKEKLDGIEEGANKTVVDSELSDTSTNPVQNKVVTEKIKNHASFSVLTTDANEKTYIKIGKFTGNGAGGRAIFTINGKVGWNNKNDGGLKILTLSSNDCRDATSTDIWTGGSMFDFGRSDNDGTTIIEDTPDIQIALVRPIGYSVKEVDVYLKFSKNKYNSYLFTVDFTDGCNWETDIKSILTTDPDPMETALSAFVVPKKRFADVEDLDKKVNLTNGTIQGAVDWNTITKTGCYKIQNCTMTADYNAPLNEYVYGVLQVLNSENETGEYRVTQIYIPHSPKRYSLWIRTNNSTTGYNNWTDWFPFNNAFQLYTKFSTKADIETGTCTLTAYSDTVFGTVSNEILLNWASDTSKYYTTGSTNSDGTLTVQGAGNARIINAYNINATGTVGIEFAVSGTGAIKIEIKGGGTTYTSGNISLSTSTQKIQITHATSGITVLNDVEINIYASGETALTIENLLKITEASTRTLTGNYELIGNQVTVSVLVDNLQNGGEIALYPLPFVPKLAKSGVCGAFSSSSYSSAIYYDIDGTTARIYLNDAPQSNKQLTFTYTV